MWVPRGSKKFDFDPEKSVKAPWFQGGDYSSIYSSYQNEAKVVSNTGIQVFSTFTGSHGINVRVLLYAAWTCKSAFSLISI